MAFAGIGNVSWCSMLRIKAAGDDDTSTKAVFAYQIGLGVSYPVTSNISLDVGYRFTGKSNAKDKEEDYKVSSSGDHSFLLTSRFMPYYSLASSLLLGIQAIPDIHVAPLL